MLARCSVRGSGPGHKQQRFTRADMVFFCLFPLLFLVFNLVYWWSVIQWREETWNTFRCQLAAANWLI